MGGEVDEAALFPSGTPLGEQGAGKEGEDKDAGENSLLKNEPLKLVLKGERKAILGGGGGGTRRRN